MNSSRSGRFGVSQLALRRAARRLATAGLVLGVMSCGGQDPTSAPSLARGGGTAGTKGPAVSATNPRFAARGVSLDVQVIGSGFSPGDRAVWALNGDTTFAVTRIKVNSTTYVSATQLTANVTLGADAQVDLYDVVVVTLAGKKGIGIELFEVTLEIIDLGLGDGSVATGINGNAQIVGRSSGGAFVWEGGVITYLQRLPGAAGAQADDINAGGAIVGTSGSRAVVWKPRSVGGYDPPIDLGTLGGCCSEATAINDDGTIAGDSRLPGDAVSHAVYWDSNGQIHDIQTVQGGESFTWGINSVGQVVGQWDGPGYQQAFRYTAGIGMELLPAIGGLQGVALDINTLGQVVGWSEPSPGAPLHATLWDGNAVVDMGTLGGSSSVAIATTEDGRVVGRSVTAARRGGSTQYVAFLWTSSGGMKALGSASFKDYNYAQAWDINANGWIVGENGPFNGARRATLWKPQGF